MNTIDSLNARYVDLGNMQKVLSKVQEAVNAEQRNFSASATERFLRSLSLITQRLSSTICATFPFLSDTIAISQKYQRCLSAISGYKEVLLKVKTSASVEKNAVVAAANTLKAAQAEFDRSNTAFQKKYRVPIDSVDTMNSALCQAIHAALSCLNEEMAKLLGEAKAIMAHEVGIELDRGTNIVQRNQLPNEMLVARSASKRTPCAILHDSGITYSYENIVNNIRNSGNVLIKTSFANMSDDAIDAFIAAYIIRYIESFPLGSVNVHIVDNNASFLYKRLRNSFLAEDVGETASKVVRLYSTMDVVSNFQEVVCDDISKKIPSGHDLYTIYKNDQTDAFNLIVLRDGLVNNSGYAQPEILDAVRVLSKINGEGHMCGVRFLIVDDSGSFEKSLNEPIRLMLTGIHKNCELQFEYTEDQFVHQGKPVEVLRIPGNVDGYVQERSQAIAHVLASKERAHVTLDEVADKDADSHNDSIMYIPVGKSGTEAIRLPLSCKDDRGSVAGQCIGYMAIGQSGSGKSSFFHSLVLNGCMKYSPRDLQFWLLDFKYGGASSKYRHSGIPHIRIIAENNKIDDALCLFQMILEEMERRNKAFKQCFVDNIVDYNRIAEQTEALEYFPRVVIAIDEIQEIFREDSASVLQKLIASISVRMRSAGMHFVMVAQNLAEGKAYMLKEAFLSSASGRICFRVAQNIPRDSGFPEEFAQRKQEITELKTGEAYVSYGKGTIKKVKMAYASPEEMSTKYFAEICAKYPEYAGMKPLVIGSKQRLLINHPVQKAAGTYFDAISKLNPTKGTYSAIIGEDAYRMTPMYLRFSQYENSAVMLLGNSKEISSSLCTSIAAALTAQGGRVHLLNGDRTPIQDDFESYVHPFMHFCQQVSLNKPNASNYRLSELGDVLKKLYTEYLRRQAETQKADDVPAFDAEFLIINDLFGIESFASNDYVENSTSSDAAPVRTFGRDLFARMEASSAQRGSQFKENIQSIMATLVKNGYRYNIHVVLAIKGDPSAWRNFRVTSEVNNLVLFNTTQFADHIENSYYLKEMLRNIASEDGNETMAVWASKRGFSKVRPIIYKMSVPAECERLDALIKGE